MGREITVGIDAGGLNPAIPDIAIDVAGQKRIEQQHIGSQQIPGPKISHSARSGGSFGETCRDDRQKTRGDGQRDEGIVAESLEGKGGDQGQSGQDSADAGQQMERWHVVTARSQPTELTATAPGIGFMD